MDLAPKQQKLPWEESGAIDEMKAIDEKKVINEKKAVDEKKAINEKRGDAGRGTMKEDRSEL